MQLLGTFIFLILAIFASLSTEAPVGQTTLDQAEHKNGFTSTTKSTKSLNQSNHTQELIGMERFGCSIRIGKGQG